MIVNTLVFIVLCCASVALGMVARIAFRNINGGATKRRFTRKKAIAAVAALLIVAALLLVAFSFFQSASLYSPLSSSSNTTANAPTAFTLVSVQEQAGGNWKTYSMYPPPYVIMTNSSGESSAISWPQNYTEGETTQIDLQPSNITVTTGSNVEQVVPYAAGQPLNVTISSGLQSFSLSTFSEIRITPPALGLSSASSTPSSSPSPQSALQSLQNWIGNGLLVYSGSFASFITIGYFASSIALKIRSLRT
jgi:hypothetical protein